MLSPGQHLLQAHRVLMRAGLSLVSLFSWVFVFEYAYAYSHSVESSFFVALVSYGLSQVTLMLLTPFSAAHLRSGIKRSMVFGACVAALAFAVLGATLTGYFSSPLGWGIALFGVLLGLYRALYWIPYRLERSAAGGGMNIYFELLIALLPAFAGISLATVYLSSVKLLFGGAVLVALSILPIFAFTDLGEKFEWGYGETFARLLDRRYRNLSLRSAFAGAESAALFIVWPISVFLIVGGSYLIFGFVMSASLLVLFVARSLYRDIRKATGNSMALDVAFSMSGWIFRLVAGAPVTIVFADSYSYVSAPSGSPEFAAREHAADSGSYLDEYTALQELAMAAGRIIMCALVSVLLFVTPLAIALALSLVLAALAAGAAAVLSHKTRVEAY